MPVEYFLKKADAHLRGKSGNKVLILLDILENYEGLLARYECVLNPVIMIIIIVIITYYYYYSIIMIVLLFIMYYIYILFINSFYLYWHTHIHTRTHTYTYTYTRRWFCKPVAPSNDSQPLVGC